MENYVKEIQKIKLHKILYQKPTRILFRIKLGCINILDGILLGFYLGVYLGFYQDCIGFVLGIVARIPLGCIRILPRIILGCIRMLQGFYWDFGSDFHKMLLGFHQDQSRTFTIILLSFVLGFELASATPFQGRS